MNSMCQTCGGKNDRMNSGYRNERSVDFFFKKRENMDKAGIARQR